MIKFTSWKTFFIVWAYFNTIDILLILMWFSFKAWLEEHKDIKTKPKRKKKRGKIYGNN